MSVTARTVTAWSFPPAGSAGHRRVHAPHPLAVCILLGLLPLTAAAQQGSDTGAQPQAQKKPAQAEPATPVADAADADKVIELEGLVVTARRRAERAQDVPIALSVVTGEQIEAGGSANLQEIYRQVPSLRVVNTNPRNVSMTIRGLGANLASEMLVNSVGVFVDGVYYARPGASAFDFLDIERMEVLRGPQGTLFGKNTTAGALNITTRAPTFEPEGSLLVSTGNYDYYKVAGTYSAGITDTVAGRITAAVNSRDGTITNVNTGDKLNDLDDKSVRGQLLFMPDNGWNVSLSGDYSKQHLNCCTDVIDRVVTTYDDGITIPNGFYFRAGNIGYEPLPIDPFARHTDIDSPQYYGLKQWGVSAKVDWDMPSGHTLTSITAYRKWSFDPYNDLDMTAVPVLLQGAFFSRSNTFTQEFRLASSTGQPLEYVVGLYYLDDELKSRTDQIFGASAGGWILPGLPQTISGPALDGFSGIGSSLVKTRSISAFGHATWRITDAFSLSGGLRYTDERKSGYSEQSSTGGPPLASFPAALQPTIAAIRAASAPTFDTRLTEGFPSSRSEGDLSDTLSASYRFSEEVNLYASYARGYKSGGINFGANVPASNIIIEPETADSFELGLKTNLLDNQLVFNVAAFHTDVKDYQSSRVFTSPAGATTIYISNVPKIRTRGLELDATYTPVTRLMLGGSLAYTDAYYVDDPVDQCPLVNPTGICDLTGESLINVSKLAGYLRGSYEFAPRGNVVPYVNADISYRSHFYAAASAHSYVPSYAISNLSVGMRFGKFNGDLSLWVHNLFDKEYYLYRTPLIFNTGAIAARLGDPRTYGITYRQQF